MLFTSLIGLYGLMTFVYDRAIKFAAKRDFITASIIMATIEQVTTRVLRDDSISQQTPTSIPETSKRRDQSLDEINRRVEQYHQNRERYEADDDKPMQENRQEKNMPTSKKKNTKASNFLYEEAEWDEEAEVPPKGIDDEAKDNGDDEDTAGEDDAEEVEENLEEPSQLTSSTPRYLQDEDDASDTEDEMPVNNMNKEDIHVSATNSTDPAPILMRRAPITNRKKRFLEDSSQEPEF